MAFSWKHDVFLSFRGKDTRLNFTSHLYHALRSKGVNTFIDGKIERGEEITPAIVDAIKGSRIFIVVFSRDYASSSYCLDELLTMLACCKSKAQVLLPIFYKIDPQDVENQTGLFGDAMDKLEAQFNGNIDKVRRWRVALTRAAKLSGYPLDNGDEAKFIQSIVENVWTKLNRPSLHVPDYPVGLEFHVGEVISMLSIGFEDVRMVGICGTGGIGKTTIAKAIFNKIANQFEGSCFLENVSRTSGLESMRLQGDNILVANFAGSINCIKQRLSNKKVFIVIDDVDVDSVDQLKTLAAVNCFSSGSMIVITARDEHLLVVHGVKRVHKVKELCPDDALALFSRHAFKSPQPADDYMELSRQVVNYAQGLPLALVVLGSFLYERKVPEWESEIAKLKRILHKQIYEILKISYDGLDYDQQAIFLDIACFFKGMDRDVVEKILEACGFNPVIGVKVLIEKNLISVENDKIQMHSLLQQMGRQVVHQQCLKPNRRSRLWCHEDVLQVLEGNMGTDDIEGIMLGPPENKEVRLSAEAFVKMERLRILVIHNAHIMGPLDLPNELRWLEWPECPLPSMPSGFCARKLVGLNMHRSCIKQFGEDFKNYNHLKFMDLRDSEFLVKTPDFSAIPHLERLNLGGCLNLTEVHESVGYLEKLELLSFEFCSELKKLPSKFKLRSLRTLLLSGCTKLEAFPDIVGEMKWLEKVCLDGTAIKVLPLSIENLTGLKVLNLTYCRSLTSLPSTIYRLQHLKHLLVEGCSKLREFPVTPDMHSLSGFLALRCLDLRDCNLVEINFLTQHDCFYMLKYLDLSGNNFASLPASIHLFSNLRSLKLSKCKKLREIPELPPNVKRIEARDCESLERFPQLARVFRCNKDERPNRLHDVDFSNCHKLAENDSKFLEIALRSKRLRQDLRIEMFLPGCGIPEFFIRFSQVDSLSFKVSQHECKKVRALVLCAILSLKDGGEANISRQVFINGQNVINFSRQFFSLESDHLWLYYLPRRFIRGLHQKQNGQVHFEILFKVLGASMGLRLKQCGVYLIRKQDEVADDPSVSQSLSFKMESLSVDLKRSCDDLEQNLCSKMRRKGTTEETLMVAKNAQQPVRHQMLIDTGEHKGKQWLCLSLQPVAHMNSKTMCFKNLEDRVEVGPNLNKDQPASTSQLQQPFSESNGHPTRFRTMEDHGITFDALKNEPVLPLALALQPMDLTQDGAQE